MNKKIPHTNEYTFFVVNSNGLVVLHFIYTIVPHGKMKHHLWFLFDGTIIV